jgi:hypothetical protein
LTGQFLKGLSGKKVSAADASDEKTSAILTFSLALRQLTVSFCLFKMYNIFSGFP